MANGKGWLDCTDCVNFSSFSDKSSHKFIEKCEFHHFDLPLSEMIQYQHRFCSDFVPNDDKKKTLNGIIRKNVYGAFYYPYNPEKFPDTSKDFLKQNLETKLLYIYFYNVPDKIEGFKTIE